MKVKITIEEISETEWMEFKDRLRFLTLGMVVKSANLACLLSLR